MEDRNRQVIVIAALIGACFVVYGCASGPDAGGKGAKNGKSAGVAHKSPPGAGGTGFEPVSTLVDARPAALVNGKSMTWGELRPTLNEIAGAEALQEVILDREIDRALGDAGITLPPDAAAGERKVLLESLSDDVNQAIRLLDELRDRQKLGKVRFEALMRRNAALRALVKDKVDITEEAIGRMHELMHGPKRQARLMVLPDLETAQAAINLVKSGVSFADAAVEMSVDSSASRGGLLEPISQVDPAYPESLRQTLWSLNPGDMSGPVLLDNRYGVLMLIKRISGDGSQVKEMKPALERMVRLQQERFLMDQLARKLLADVQVTVFDDELHESWSRRGRGGN